jgi:hypothetical protein
VLHRVQWVQERERAEVILTNVSAGGAFVQARSTPAVGARLVLEARTGGPQTPLVELTTEVVRTVPAGGMWPAGFAVAWRQARCVLGPAQLRQFLDSVLHVVPATEDALRLVDRVAVIDSAHWRAAAAPSSLAVAASSATGVLPALKATQPEPQRARPGAAREAPESVPAAAPATTGRGVVPAADEVLPWLRVGAREPTPPPMAQAGLRGGRPVFQETTDIRPLRTPVATPAPWSERPRSPMGDEATLPGEGLSGVHAPAGRRLLKPVDVPVSYVRDQRFSAARAVGLSAQAVAVVTQGEPPGLDEPLVVHLPVASGGMFSTLYLNGKLLQVAHETAEGRRFVMHIERVDEGAFEGVFAGLLAQLDA